MKIIIDPKAKKFINSKNEVSITVWVEGCSSWGVGEPQPSVKMGKPSEIDDYDLYQVDGIDAYVRCDIEAKNDEVKIKYSKLLWNEKLIVEGILV